MSASRGRRGSTRWPGRGVAAADELGPGRVYAGFSFGVMIAQQLAQTRPGPAARCSCTPASRSRSSARHGRRRCRCRSTARRATSSSSRTCRPRASSPTPREQAELFLYPGEQHLFADSSLPDYDAAAAASLMERVLAFLAAITQKDGRAHVPAQP